VTSKTACLLLATTLLAAAGAASAQDFTPKAKGTWVVDYRLTDVSPDEKAPINTSGGVATGLHASINDSIVPTLGVGYFLTDNVALDLTLGASHQRGRHGRERQCARHLGAAAGPDRAVPFQPERPVLALRRHGA